MKSEKRFYTLIAIPGVLYLCTLVIFPIISTIIYSLQKYDFINPSKKIVWLYFANYLKIFHDPSFWIAAKNTLIFVLSGIFFEFIFGLIIALLLNKLFTKNNFVTSLILMPSIMAPIAVGLIFRFMFNSEFGIYSYILNKIGLFNGVSLLGSKATALGTVIVADIWEWTPFVAIILLAGLIALPAEPFEAARIDGANSFGVLTKITLPLLKPVIRIALLLRVVDIIKEFDKLFVMTYGGPGNASEILNFTAYRINYINFDMGLGSAYVVIIMIIIILISMGLFRVLRSTDAY